MARYLKSQTTGVVLPFNEKLRKRPNIELMTPAECIEYEASVQARLNGTAEVPTSVVEEPTSVVEEPTSVVQEPTPAIETLPDEDQVVSEQPVVESTVDVSDFSEGEPNAKELLAALEID